MSDREALKLLQLLRDYAQEYGNTEDMKLSEIAEDIVSSLDAYDPEAEAMKDEIMAAIVSSPRNN